jgi:hypothetical protein
MREGVYSDTFIDVFVEDGIVISNSATDVGTDEDRIATAQNVYAAMMELFARHPKEHYRVLINLQAVRKDTGKVPRPMRKIYSDIMNHHAVEKIAFVGDNMKLVRYLNYFLALVLPRVTLKLFNDLDLAMKWVRS